jgi:nucleoside-diphosphate-sugar epimerase
MKIAVTGATGFIGHYLVRRLVKSGHQLQLWHRAGSDRSGLSDLDPGIEWVEGELGIAQDAQQLVHGCDAVIHAGLWRPGQGFRGSEGDVVEFARVNLLGTLQLIEAARTANVERFIFVSTCAVHEVILEDRLLDEAHPLWPMTHYGAHKAAIEKFVHSYGLGEGYPVCSLRPTGVYGQHNNPHQSKWYSLVERVAAGESVDCQRGGKEVHADDVARALELLLTAPDIAGQAYSCYDMYISDHAVAQIAQSLSGSNATITGHATQPRNQIDTSKIRALGMTFGGQPLLEETISQLLNAVRQQTTS